MSISFEILTPEITPLYLDAILNGKATIAIDRATLSKIDICHQYLQNRIHSSDQLLYGINTGFGSLCNVAVEDDKISQLQVNLIRSHACGAGNVVPLEISRLILFLKIRSLSYGHSAVYRLGLTPHRDVKPRCHPGDV